MLLITISGCKEKDVTVAKDYTSIICKVHNERVYRREFNGASVDYTRSYGQFLLSQDWRAKYPYAIINYNEDIHAEDETKRFLYHLVCDRCQNEFKRDREGFDSGSKDLEFAVIVDDVGTPFVDEEEVSLDRLRVLLVEAVNKQPGVEVTIIVPYNLSFKHERTITRVAHLSGVTFLQVKRSSQE